MRPSLLHRQNVYLAYHVVVIEVPPGTPRPVGFALPPNTSMRIFSSGLSILNTLATFKINDSSGSIVYGPVDESINLVGHAWSDTSAPPQDGAYTAVVTEHGIPLLVNEHDSSVGFVVDSNAPVPPPVVTGGGLFGDIKFVLIAVAVIAGIIVLGGLGRDIVRR